MVRGWTFAAAALLVWLGCACGPTQEGTLDNSSPPSVEQEPPVPEEPRPPPPPVIPPPPVCQPTSCQTLGKNCGTVEDGCGGTLDCGTCGEGQQCGMAGLANVCTTGPAACALNDLGSQLPVRVTGPLPGDLSHHPTPCGDEGTDTSFSWTAPEAGTYVFDTSGSAYAVRLFIREGGCEGPVLFCDRTLEGPGFVPAAVLPLEAGETVLVVLDGATAREVDFALRIDKVAASESVQCQDGEDDDGDGAVDCQDADCALDAACTVEGFAAVELGSRLPVSYVGSTSLKHLRFQASCNAMGYYSPERVHRFTPPKTGEYALHVLRSDPGDEFTPMLQVLSDCVGTELACHASLAGRKGLRLSLEAGRPVLVVVRDMGLMGGFYRLSIAESVETEAGLCADGLDNDLDGRWDAHDPDCMRTQP